MPEQTEKLLHFTEEVLRNATQQSEQMKHELDEARAAALAEAKIEAKDAARVYYDREAARIRAESGQEVSRHLMESKRQIYLRRKEITQEVFQKVCERIAAFTASPDYYQHMEQMLRCAMEQLPGAKSVVVQLRAEDMAFAPRWSARREPFPWADLSSTAASWVCGWTVPLTIGWRSWLATLPNPSGCLCPMT